MCILVKSEFSLNAVLHESVQLLKETKTVKTIEYEYISPLNSVICAV